MKRFTLLFCLLAMSIPGWGDQNQERLSRKFYQQCSNLKNTAAALEMWYYDHGCTYPTSLSELTPNYLKHLLPGPQGGVNEVSYLMEPNQQKFRLQISGTYFQEIQLAANYPQYDSERGLVLNDGDEPLSLTLNLLTPDLEPDWMPQERPLGKRWTRSSDQISSSICLTQVESEAERLFLGAYSDQAETVVDERTTPQGERLRLVSGVRSDTHLRFLELRGLQGATLRLLAYETPGQPDAGVAREFKRLLAGL